MIKNQSLVLLIKSLSKGEKRYFKLRSALQDGAKDYLHLFDLIERNNNYSDLKANYLSLKPQASFEVTSNYLFKLIMDALFYLKSDKDLEAKLNKKVIQVQLLFEKGLFEDGFKWLKRIKIEAENTELTLITFWANKLELQFITELGFHTISEDKLITKHAKTQSLLKNELNLNQHTALYQLLRHRLIYKGNVRTKEQKEDLNDLLITEVGLISKSTAGKFESKKTHLLFQAYYMISVGNYPSALLIFYDLMELFEKHQLLWQDAPNDYLYTLEGILDSLVNIQKFDEMDYFLDKLNSLDNKENFGINISRIDFTYKTRRYLNKGLIYDAIELLQHHKITLFGNLALINPHKQAEVQLYASIIYFINGNLTEANQTLNRVLLNSKSFYVLPIYRTFRLLHLLVHYELKNHDYLLHEKRSIKRSMTGFGHQNYLIEKILFRFLSQKKVYQSPSEKIIFLKKIKNNFDKIKVDRYENRILNIFNFEAWVEANVLNKPLIEILQNHTNYE
ncbi:hypothetical protein A5893_09465 [Pedobacter psychrophilus]|uniref:Uncharacterized protein n=1 Tax=Pedobacter psychrophilus TaxID=1826909 RepID=A0A179DFG7_9SPHI|nr:hypothetical protein [Pedobacter psychrophilus]OAQ39795.1 hypothetical protein A5893_09465 [Pedobacter psychrophilus]